MARLHALETRQAALETAVTALMGSLTAIARQPDPPPAAPLEEPARLLPLDQRHRR
jgi:hypothetical protein